MDRPIHNRTADFNPGDFLFTYLGRRGWCVSWWWGDEKGHDLHLQGKQDGIVARLAGERILSGISPPDFAGDDWGTLVFHNEAAAVDFMIDLAEWLRVHHPLPWDWERCEFP